MALPLLRTSRNVQLQTKGCATVIAMMMDSEKPGGEHPNQPTLAADKAFGSVGSRFDKVEADMREGFARVGHEIRDLRAEMNARLLPVSADFKSFQRTMIGTILGALALNKIF